MRRASLEFRFGKFKTPPRLERIQPATVLPLVERGQPTNLVPIRGLGAPLCAACGDGAFGYRIRALDPAPDPSDVTGRIGDDFDFIGRVCTQPFPRRDS